VDVQHEEVRERFFCGVNCFGRGWTTEKRISLVYLVLWTVETGNAKSKRGERRK